MAERVSLRGILGLGSDGIGRYLARLVSILLIGWALWFFRDLALLLLFSILLAYVLGPVADFFQRKTGAGRTAAVLLTFASVVGTASVIVAALVPFVQRQLVDLGRLLSPRTIAVVGNSIESSLRNYMPVPEGAVNEGLIRAFEALFRQEQLGLAFSATIDLFATILFALIILPLVTFFFMKDGQQVLESLLRLVPNRYFELTVDLLQKVEHNLGRYFRALLLRGIVVSVVSGLLLAAIGLRYAVGVGLFNGLANTIPYFGPVIGIFAAAIVGIAQTGDLSLLPGIILAIFLTQMVDNVIQPFVFSRAVRIHPIVILCVVIIGAELAGIVGMFLAIPVLTILWVTVKQINWSLRNYYVFRVG